MEVFVTQEDQIHPPVDDSDHEDHHVTQGTAIRSGVIPMIPYDRNIPLLVMMMCQEPRQRMHGERRCGKEGRQESQGDITCVLWLQSSFRLQSMKEGVDLVSNLLM